MVQYFIYWLNLARSLRFFLVHSKQVWFCDWIHFCTLCSFLFYFVCLFPRLLVYLYVRVFEIDQSNERAQFDRPKRMRKWREREKQAFINLTKSSCCGVISYYIYRSCQSIEHGYRILHNVTNINQTLWIRVHVVAIYFL